jgi:hypothetical protein
LKKGHLPAILRAGRELILAADRNRKRGVGLVVVAKPRRVGVVAVVHHTFQDWAEAANLRSGNQGTETYQDRKHAKQEHGERGNPSGGAKTVRMIQGHFSL